ncbi:MAG: acyltransferase family protein, partial [Candidatus Omnitrophica bacterium]|nr:acyltransferase family protein [Candidatus Omnitrophota bacterium]
SGYLMSGSLSQHSLRQVFQSRVKSLLVPFVVLGLLCALVTNALNALFHVPSVPIFQNLAVQLFFDPSVWFLWVLFAVSALLMYSVALRKFVGWGGFAGVYVLLMALPYSYAALYHIKWFYLFYLAGYGFHQRPIKVSGKGINAFVFVLALGFFTWFLTFWRANDYVYINKMHFAPDDYIAQVLRLAYRYIIGFLGIVIVFYAAAFLSRTRISSLLGAVGVYALDIYIVQTFLVEGVYPRLVHKAGWCLDFNSPQVLYIMAPLMTMVFVGACMLISKFFIRKVPLFNRLLLGGRA